MNFKLEQKVKVTVTDDLSKSILQVLKEASYKKPLIVMDSFLNSTPIVNKLKEDLTNEGIDFIVYDKIVSDPPTNLVDEGAVICNKQQCDSIIAIGGGSSIDVARGINIVKHNGGKIKDYVTFEGEIKECPGLISVPTTSGTGSELSNALIVTDLKTNTKLAVLADNSVSEYAILNPELLMSLPKNMTIATGLDTFSHAAEGYTSNLSSPVTDAICEKIMFLVAKYLPLAVEDGSNREARERMMVAAALGGWMLNNCGTHIGHSTAHILGSKYKIPHGMACAYALPGALEHVAPVLPKKIKEIGYILGATFPENASVEEIASITSNRYRDFRDNILGMAPFSELQIDKNELLTNAKDIVEERFAGNTPRKVDLEAAVELLKKL
ncbi:iron-containing alcohol dehydrogenase [Vagococcus intermedius]|uniref:Iron-containing alcohol dehydrogenase n=1 Tax=Vagococcus intermedius TaxID=2991418 RepID=A0AAF0I6T0_9ENTE|nr:iron-containing alcohol dehydrogenase [Vagococcus intermedius]WEG72571.1 iron-containing alcohol dehydrogenase [Vagococcus intermedius]WEG74657.1 iron-containing alcohol dehydrogenase [Vagococcus intermedius]